MCNHVSEISFGNPTLSIALHTRVNSAGVCRKHAHTKQIERVWLPNEILTIFNLNLNLLAQQRMMSTLRRELKWISSGSPPTGRCRRRNWHSSTAITRSGPLSDLKSYSSCTVASYPSFLHLALVRGGCDLIHSFYT